MKPILHIYTRASSAVQAEEATSLQTREDQGLQKADALEFDHKIWNEGGQSSKYEDLENRPVPKRLLVEIENGNVEHLFVFNTARFRNQVQHPAMLGMQWNNDTVTSN